MKYSKLVALGLAGALSLGIVGCSNNTNDNQKSNIEKSSTQTDTSVTQENTENMNRDMYKKRFGELYQTNIARLENYNTYTNIPVQEPTKDYEGNQKYLDDLKAAYKDSETNIQQFVDSLKDVKTDDKEVQDMNDKLVKQGENLLADIKTKIQKLDDVPADLLNKPEVEFKQGINDLVTDTDNNKNGTDTMDTDFNKMLKDVRNTLGIK